MNHIIKVTEEDIEKATRKSSSHCAIATAIEQEIKGASYISVDIQTIRFSVGETRYVYLTPRAAQKAIIDFDYGKEPKPFRLSLKNPQTVKRHTKDKPELVRGTGGNRHIPRVNGGRPPPKASTRREFGLRSFDI